MLTEDQFDVLPNNVLDVYEEYTLSVIRDIARRLAGMDMTSTAAWQMQRLTESGKTFENALKELSKLTGKSEAELRAAFKAAGVKSIRFDDSIYKAAGLNPLPLNLSPAMSRVLAIGLQKTQGVMNNLTLTTATNSQQLFISAADQAYMQVSSGAMSYDQAIRSAIKSVGASGLEVTYPGGARDKLDVAMRRTVLTGVSQTAGKLQEARADEMGQDLVQVSAHAGARNTGIGPANHESWQGKIYSRSGTSKRYPSFVEVTGYGTGEGLGGWNCRHSFYPYFEGISRNAYNSATRGQLARSSVNLEGERVPMYDATQMQREIERKIRYWKRQSEALKAAQLDNMREAAKVAEWQRRMREFIEQTKLNRQRVREQT